MTETPENKQELEKDPTNTFLTGVNIDVDAWREQTVEELTAWLNDIKSKKTEFGDPLVDFPDGWDQGQNLSTNQQIDVIAKGLAAKLQGAEAKEAKADLQNIRAQADKLKQLEKQLAALDADDDEIETELSKEDEAFLDEEIVIPNIDVSGPNPFEIDPDSMKRLKEIDEKLGTTDEDMKQPTRTMEEINNDIMKLYQNPEGDKPENVTLLDAEEDNKESDETKEPSSERPSSTPKSPQEISSLSPPVEAASAPKSPPHKSALKSPLSSALNQKPIPPLQQITGDIQLKQIRSKKPLMKK
ncbi:hypothetical protein TVAG_482080 [Trichomonas vaginalis G3]|uniref:Uncharacterized protein n=1 Tax=Trichomonas vaginalis (strain ATCC PRA-98 / G3) TaxID=412133 RepID=A2EBL7_TRIV3|nr:hypothetical protein TVAGG3_0588450 [Trichomonas vaginalis G3]EAY09934.1 hypothetical protein TVAG_482080 [Trichomonas vaginalis G3]KAI5523072.1 hypothetical protein TVAGG3_0588450 [Trichomonas vaginalis G3]|eukprot:XP_001322157.1 hypothetical protein [Trichomonas vaginalis G3]